MRECTQKSGNRNQRLLVNCLQVCIASYGLLNYSSKYPYAYAACAFFALCDGLFGFVHNLQQTECCNKDDGYADGDPLEEFLSSLMDFMLQLLTSVGQSMRKLFVLPMPMPHDLLPMLGIIMAILSVGQRGHLPWDEAIAPSCMKALIIEKAVEQMK